MIVIGKSDDSWLLLWSHKDWSEHQVPFLRITLGPDPRWPWADSWRLTAPFVMEEEIWLPFGGFTLRGLPGNVGEPELQEILRIVNLPNDVPTVIRQDFDEWRRGA